MYPLGFKRLWIVRSLRRCKRSLESRFNVAIIAATVASLAALVVACNLDRVGEGLLTHGQYREAIPYYEVMTGVERALGTRSIRLADALTDLGTCYAKCQRMRDAVQVQQIAVEMRRSVLADEATAVLKLESEPALKGIIPSASARAAPNPVLITVAR